MEKCLSERFLIVDGFLKDADSKSMRQDIDAHFADPYLHKSERHEVWNFWHVPGTYTYLRTTPEKVIARDKIAAFVDQLRLWAAVNLGFATVTWPFLGLYVPGCSQILHNDSTNGRLGYVYSLTRDQRRTTGGETLVMQDRDLFRSNLATAAAGIGLFDLVEPRFNRLTLFDDRVPHGVQRVEGVMDPVEGRFVLHGHIREAGVVAQGPLRADVIQSSIDGVLRELKDSAAPTVKGPIVLRVEIADDGRIKGVRAIVDRLASSANDDLSSLRELILSRLKDSRLPEAEGPTVANLPLIF